MTRASESSQPGRKLLALFLVVLALTGAVVAAPLVVPTSAAAAANAETIETCTVIEQPGVYELTADIADSTAESCIVIASSDVVLDGNGHVVDGVDEHDTYGVNVTGDAAPAVRNVTVMNITVSDWTTGVRWLRTGSETDADGATLRDVTAVSNGRGISLYRGASNATLRDVTAVRNGGGVAIESDDAHLEGVNASSNDAGSGVVIEGARATVRDLEADDNDLDGLEIVGDDTGVDPSSVRHVSATGNQRGSGIVVDRGNVTVAEAVVNDNAAFGLIIKAPGVTARNVTARGNHQYAGVRAEQDALLVDITSTDNTGQGVTAPNRATLRRVTVVNNTEQGVKLTLDATLENVTAYGNGGADVYHAENAEAGGGAMSATSLDLGGPGDVNTTLSLTGRSVALRPVAAPPENPNATAIGRYFNATRAASWLPPSGLNVSVHYADSDLDGVDESTLQVWRYDNGTWSPVDSTVDPAANTVTANLTDFSEFGVFGTESPPGNVSVAIEGTNAPVTENETLDVTAVLENSGGATTQEVSLLVGDVERDAGNVSLASGGNTTVSLSWTTGEGDAGNYTAVVIGENDSASTGVSVEETDAGGEEPGSATFAVDIESTNAPVSEGETLDVTAAVANTGDARGTTDVVLSVGGRVRYETEVSLAAGEHRTLSLSWTTGRGDGGTYTASVAAGDASDDTTVVVRSDRGDQDNEPPNVAFEYAPTTPRPGEEVAFDADATDIDGTVERYRWRVDGRVVSTDPMFAYTFEEAGTRTVTLTVTDDDGATNETTRTVEVAEVGPTGVDVWHSPVSPGPGEEVTLVADAGLDDPSAATYEWTVDGGEAVETDGPYLQRSFARTGEYVVKVRVVTPGSEVVEGSVVVTVEEASEDAS